MASGSYEIDTYSWYRSLPLNGCTEGYSTGTMFAVGPCAFLQPYTFYEYQSSVGFTDTSTMSTSFGTFICTSLMSTTVSLQSSIYLNRRQYISTIPLTQWISSYRFASANLDLTSSIFLSTAAASNFPWYYDSTIASFPQNFTSSFVSSISTSFISSGLFGFITSNLYPTCAPYTLFSTVPVSVSSFRSTLASTIPFSFTSTMISTNFSSIAAIGEIYDFNFNSTFNTLNTIDYNAASTFTFRFPSFWLGDQLRRLIDSKQYDVIVDLQYSIYMSTSKIEEPTAFPQTFMWVSTVGTFGNNIGDLGVNSRYTGVASRTRVGNCNFMEIFNRQMFHPNIPGEIIELGFVNSNYRPVFNASPGIPMFSSLDAYVDIYMPGENNMIITLVPTVSSIVLV